MHDPNKSDDFQIPNSYSANIQYQDEGGQRTLRPCSFQSLIYWQLWGAQGQGT